MILAYLHVLDAYDWLFLAGSVALLWQIARFAFDGSGRAAA